MNNDGTIKIVSDVFGYMTREAAKEARSFWKEPTYSERNGSRITCGFADSFCAPTSIEVSTRKLPFESVEHWSKRFRRKVRKEMLDE